MQSFALQLFHGSMKLLRIRVEKGHHFMVPSLLLRGFLVFNSGNDGIKGDECAFVK